MDTEFKNEERRRYYGKRIGDIVDAIGLTGKAHHSNAEVVGFAYGDNNRLYIKCEDGKITDWVAEWCNVITKVEDIPVVKERIICAANYYNDGVIHTFRPKNITEGYIICGHRHHNCIDVFTKIVGFPYTPQGHKLHQTEIQGFLTNTNRFVNRKEAYKIAFEADQIVGPNKGYPTNEIGLTSEDLY